MRILLALALLLTLCCGQPAPSRVPPLDLEILRRTDAQLQNLRMQFQLAADPILREQQAVNARACAAAKIEISQCQIDFQTGLIARKPQPASAVVPAAKPK